MGPVALIITSCRLSLSTVSFFAYAHPAPPGINMILPGFTGSLPISVSVEPAVSRSTIVLSSAYRLQLLPILGHHGHYICDICLSVPTRSGFYTFKISLECVHSLGGAEVTLGSDWVAACSPTLCSDGLEDPVPTVISSFPAHYHWNSSNGTSASDWLWF